MGGGGEMTNEQINVTIAQACGWTILQKPLSGFGFAAYAKEPNGDPSPGIPDYCDDLNAMHEAEKVLTEKQVRLYPFTLAQVLDLDDQFLNIHATARQRAEAFLRTLEKWEPVVKECFTTEADLLRDVTKMVGEVQP
jgi:hypothetical protein